MRKWVWGGFALAMFAGAGVYLAADHTFRHPESFVGHCAVSAFKLTMQVNSFVLNRVAGVAPMRGLGERCSTMPDKPVCRQQPPILCMPPADSFEPIVVEVQPVSRVEYSEPAIYKPASSTTAPQNPMLMPYVEDDCDNTGVMSWFGCDLNRCQLVAACFKALSGATGGEETTQVEVVDEEVEEQQPEAQPLAPEEVSGVQDLPYHQMQVDPHHHYHYPCCPYSGRCPQPYHNAYPIIPRADDISKRTKPDVQGTAIVPVSKVPETMDCKPTDLSKDTDDEDSF